ncbi:MAG: tol-pal system protein YbgF [Alphaproteobacteria bacterium]|nr:tol-pal system protein YbgF [Alphaproteobacteria bacterium]
MTPSWLGAAFLLVAAIFLSQAVPAAAQSDLRELANRIDRLQRDIDVLQRTVATQGTAAGGGAAAAGAAVARPAEGFAGQVDQRFSQLEGQGREQTGRIEEIQHRLRQLEAKIDRLVQDVEFRFQQIEKAAPAGGAPAVAAGAAAGAAAAQAPAAAGAPGSAAGAAGGGQRLVIVPSGTSAQALQQQAAVPRDPVRLPAGPPEAQYEFAYGLLLQAQRGQSDFGPAEAAMKAFVAQNPNHRQAGAAQYWYGETLYARRDWNNAAIAFAEGFKKYPSSDKAPENLLRLGMSLGQLNRKPEACSALAEIGRRHPDAPQGLRQNAQRERQKLGC